MTQADAITFIAESALQPDSDPKILLILNQEVNILCNTSWQWNTVILDLERDIDNKFFVGTDVLHCVAIYPSIDVEVDSSGYLYDRELQSSTFDYKVLRVMLVKLLSFDDLPVIAQEYILASAQIQYQGLINGQSEVNQFLFSRKQEMDLKLKQMENKRKKPSMLNGHLDTFQALNSYRRF